jgi:hypothetical protein
MSPLVGPFGGHVDQVGIIVADLEASMDAYARTIGATFQVFEVDHTNSAFSGSSPRYRTRFGIALAGLITIELIQPAAGVTLHSEFLEKHGPGIHHLGVYVENLEEASRGLGHLGYRTLLKGHINELGRFAYFDAGDLHCVVEVLELESSFPVFLLEHAVSYPVPLGQERSE